MLALCTSNKCGYQAAIDWHQSSGKVSVICDTRSNPTGELYQEALELGLSVKTGHGIIEAIGSKRVVGAMMAELLDGGAGVSGRSENVVADVIATSGGFSPVVHLSAHLGQKPVWDEQVLGFLPNPTAIC